MHTNTDAIGLYLHAGQTDPNRGRGALLTLADLPCFLFLSGIVSMLLRAHLQV